MGSGVWVGVGVAVGGSGVSVGAAAWVMAIAVATAASGAAHAVKSEAMHKIVVKLKASLTDPLPNQDGFSVGRV